MSAWDQVALGHVCKVLPGFAFKSKDWCNDGLPVLKIKNIKGDGTIDTAEVDCVPEGLMNERMKRFSLQDGDILLAMTGATAGKVGKLKSSRNYLLNQRVAKLAPIDIDPVFFWSVVSSKEYQNRFFRLADGAAQPNMSGSQIEGVLVPFPPLETQRRIASILGTYDDLIEVNRRRVAVLEEMARGLFEEWFVRFRFPGHENVEIVETPDGPLPEGWEIVPLSNLCGRITDGAHHSPPSVEMGKLMASVRDMREWGFDYSACRQISEADWDALANADCLPRHGDILIAKDGANLNKHTFLVWKSEPVVLLSSIAMIRPADGIQRELLTAILRSPATSAAIKNMRSGAAIPRIVLKDFRRLPILWPTPAIRAAFEALVHPIHQQCRIILDANTRLSTSHDFLLPRLISGQLTVEAAERKLEVAA